MRQRHKNLSFILIGDGGGSIGFYAAKTFYWGIKTMKIWLDDIRPAPEGFTLAHSVNEAIALIKKRKWKGQVLN